MEIACRKRQTEGLAPCEIYFYLLASSCWSLGPNRVGSVAVTDRPGDVALANCGPVHPTARLDAAQRLSCKIDLCTVRVLPVTASIPARAHLPGNRLPCTEPWSVAPSSGSSSPLRIWHLVSISSPQRDPLLLTSLGSRRRSNLDTDCLCSRSLSCTSHTSRCSR